MRFYDQTVWWVLAKFGDVRVSSCANLPRTQTNSHFSAICPGFGWVWKLVAWSLSAKFASFATHSETLASQIADCHCSRSLFWAAWRAVTSSWRIKFSTCLLSSASLKAPLSIVTHHYHGWPVQISRHREWRGGHGGSRYLMLSTFSSSFATHYSARRFYLEGRWWNEQEMTTLVWVYYDCRRQGRFATHRAFEDLRPTTSRCFSPRFRSLMRLDSHFW